MLMRWMYARFVAASVALVLAALPGLADQTYATQKRTEALTLIGQVDTSRNLSHWALDQAWTKYNEAETEFDADLAYMQLHELYVTINQCEEGLAAAVGYLADASIFDNDGAFWEADANKLANGGGGATDWGQKAFNEGRWDWAAYYYEQTIVSANVAIDTYMAAVEYAGYSQDESEYVLSILP